MDNDEELEEARMVLANAAYRIRVLAGVDALVEDLKALLALIEQKAMFN